jgi:hypothetical protein
MPTKPTDDPNLPEYVTRRELVRLARQTLGLPLTRGKLNKALREGKGPERIAHWGNADLFVTAKAIDWVRSCVTHLPRGRSRNVI